MRRAMVILFFPFLVANAMMPAIGRGEIQKIPALITHFLEHRNQNPDMSFLAFLQLHYEDVNHHNQDHDKHQQLPLNHHDAHNLNVVTYAFVEVIHISISSHLSGEIELNFFERNDPTLSFSGKSWQPPRA